MFVCWIQRPKVVQAEERRSEGIWIISTTWNFKVHFVEACKKLAAGVLYWKTN